MATLGDHADVQCHGEYRRITGPLLDKDKRIQTGIVLLGVSHQN